MTSFEFAVLDWIQTSLRTPLGDWLVPRLTALGGGPVWLALGLALLLWPKTRRMGAAVLLALALEVLCCNVLLKPLVARPRPCWLNTAVPLLVAVPGDYSFPSGHTAGSFAAASALFFGGSRLQGPAAVLAALVGFTRLYLYVHFPSDVLAGAMLGIMLGWLAARAVRQFGLPARRGSRTPKEL